MSEFSKIDVKDRDLLTGLREFFKSLLTSGQVDALLVPWRLPMNQGIMPTLITRPEDMDQADPLAPCFPLNAARLASRLTKRPSGKTVGLVMRPCEIRAFIELIKLKQGSRDQVVLVGMDCLGAFNNADFARYARSGEPTRPFYESVLDGSGKDPAGFETASACRVCEHPVPANCDIAIGLYGVEYGSRILVETPTPRGKAVIQALKLADCEFPAGRKKAVDDLIAARTQQRDRMFEQTAEQTGGFEKLSAYLSRCVNCYNCRVACPVCYCRECVFVTDVFDHDAFQYMQWAGRKGRLKMPTDTDFFHLTRMAHIGLTCVGCGQCSNACPNDIPLMELFRTVAHGAQKDFGYEAGRRLDEPIPLSAFEKDEYEEVVGITSKGV